METSEMKTRLDMICNIPESQPLHCDTGHGRNDTVRTFIEIDFEKSREEFTFNSDSLSFL